MTIQLKLTPDQHDAISLISSGYNVFITGNAGTGKSFLLHYIKTLFKDKGFVITASTGIAAVQVGGKTIHSWAGIGTAEHPVEYYAEFLKSKKLTEVRNRIKKCSILAIDEISMVSASLLNKLNELFKIIRKSKLPFGGIQVVFFGDFFQLPPISKNELDANFAFESRAWMEAEIRTVVLSKIFRQDDARYVELLNHLRYGQVTREDIDILRSRVVRVPIGINATILSTHNYLVDKMNSDCLNNIQGPIIVYKMNSAGEQNSINFLKKNCLSPEALSLKKGARVMMLKNTYNADGIINGSVGEVVDFVDDKDEDNNEVKQIPRVRFANSKERNIFYEEWKLEEFDFDKMEPKTLASVEQIPLMLAWAMTVHKSQGMTLDYISCEIEKAFASGQVYVALSRVKSIDCLFLKNLPNRFLAPNPTVIKFEQNGHRWLGNTVEEEFSLISG